MEKITHLKRLKWILQTLALNFEKQISLFPEFIIVADELAIEWETAWKIVMNNDLINDEQVLGLLRDIDEQFAEMSDSEYMEFWDDNGLQTLPEWNNIRKLSEKVLQTLHWPIEEPKELGTIYINKDSIIKI